MIVNRLTKLLRSRYPNMEREKALSILHAVCSFETGRRILSRRCRFAHPSLEREVFGLRFPNPVGLAPGIDTDAKYYRDMRFLGFGFVEIGTLTPRPESVPYAPFTSQLDKDRAVVVRPGYPNAGLVQALVGLRRRGYSRKIIVGANIAKNFETSLQRASADYLALFRNLYQYVDYYTVNVTQLVEQAEAMGRSVEETMTLIQSILADLFEFRRGQDSYRPLLLKLSPDWSMPFVDRVIDILVETPLDGLVVAGPTSSRDGLVSSEDEISKAGNGGLCGAPLRQRTMELIRHTVSRVSGMYPIIASGGLMTPEDVSEALDAGASLVEVCSGLIYDGPELCGRICRHLCGAESEKQIQQQ